MKKRIITLLPSITGIIIPLIFFSCQDYLFFPQEEKKEIHNTTLTIGKAREIFRQAVSSEANTRRKSVTGKPGLSPGDFTPLWDKAKESADSLIESVDIPISTQFLYRGT
ncbi:hypothetical protein, partial [Coprobacter sp.]